MAGFDYLAARSDADFRAAWRRSQSPGNGLKTPTSRSSMESPGLPTIAGPVLCLCFIVLGVVSEPGLRPFFQGWWKWLSLLYLAVALYLAYLQDIFQYYCVWHSGFFVGIVIAPFVRTLLSWGTLCYAVGAAFVSTSAAYLFLPYLDLADQLFLGFTVAVLTAPLQHFLRRALAHTRTFLAASAQKVAGMCRHVARFGRQLAIFSANFAQDVVSWQWSVGIDVLAVAVTLVFAAGIWYVVLWFLYRERCPECWERPVTVYLYTASVFGWIKPPLEFVLNALWKLWVFVLQCGYHGLVQVLHLLWTFLTGPLRLI